MKIHVIWMCATVSVAQILRHSSHTCQTEKYGPIFNMCEQKKKQFGMVIVCKRKLKRLYMCCDEWNFHENSVTKGCYQVIRDLSLFRLCCLFFRLTNYAVTNRWHEEKGQEKVHRRTVWWMFLRIKFNFMWYASVTAWNGRRWWCERIFILWINSTDYWINDKFSCDKFFGFKDGFSLHIIHSSQSRMCAVCSQGVK